MEQRSQPDDYEPPYPAYQGRQDETGEVAMAMFGIQAPSVDDAPAMVARVHALLDPDASHGPAYFEQAGGRDGRGHYETVVMAYWRGTAGMARFLERPDVRSLLATPLEGTTGLWLEAISAADTSLDANYAQEGVHYGIARQSRTELEQFHGYMGSMRDRVPDFLSGAADGAPGQIAAVPPAASRGRVLTVSNLPEKLCFIRGAFAWKDASPQEQEEYRRKMMPVYQDGAEGLRDEPEESNCIAMRLAEDVDVGYDTGVQSNALGWFLTLADLERWTRDHPRHLAILKTIYKYMERFNFQPQLNLGHEVAVMARGWPQVLYNNCHPETGFLRFFESVPVAYEQA